jgi:ankyrin repeat protein
MDVQDIHGNTPLHYAFLHLSVAKYLVGQRGTAVDARNNDGETSLHYACLGGNLDVVKCLVEQGGAAVGTKSKDGFAPLHYACYDGQLDIIKYLVEQRGVSMKIKTHGGETPLYLSCLHPHLEVAKYFVEKGVVVDAKSNYNPCALPLHRACQIGNLELVKLLVEQGGASHATIGMLGYTALHYTCVGACEEGYGNHLDVAQYLVVQCGAAVDAKEKGFTPLHLLSWLCKSVNDMERGRCIDLLKFLLDQRGDLVGAKDDYPQRWTPLHYALNYTANMEYVTCTTEHSGTTLTRLLCAHLVVHPEGHSSIVELVKHLVEQRGASVYDQDNDGLMPLHWACKIGSFDLVKFLLEKGHSSIQAKDHEGRTPLHYFRPTSVWHQVVKLLVAKGGAAVATARDNNGATPLHYFCKHGDFTAVQCVVEYAIKHLANQEQKEEQEQMAEQVALIWAKDNNDLMPLHWACENGSNLDLIHYLVKLMVEYSGTSNVDRSAVVTSSVIVAAGGSSSGRGSIPMLPLNVVRFLVGEGIKRVIDVITALLGGR